MRVFKWLKALLFFIFPITHRVDEVFAYLIPSHPSTDYFGIKPYTHVTVPIDVYYRHIVYVGMYPVRKTIYRVNRSEQDLINTAMPFTYMELRPYFYDVIFHKDFIDRIPEEYYVSMSSILEHGKNTKMDIDIVELIKRSHFPVIKKRI